MNEPAAYLLDTNVVSEMIRPSLIAPSGLGWG